MEILLILCHYYIFSAIYFINFTPQNYQTKQ